MTSTLVRPEFPVTKESWVRRQFSSRHRVAVPLLVAGAMVLFSLISFTRLWRFEAGSYDLVIFDQAIRAYSHFQLPYAPIKAADGFGPGFSVLGDHFSPIIALLAPLYWIHDGPETLLVAQAVLLALAVVPLWAYLRRNVGEFVAYSIAGCYVLGLPVTFAANFDFHEVAFAPVLMAAMIERFDAQRRGLAPLRHTFYAVAGLLLVKEDMGLAVAGFGLYMALIGKRLPGLVLAVLGPACVAVTCKVILPAFGGRGDFYWRYDRLGPDPASALRSIVTDPLNALHVMVTPQEKLQLLLLLGLPLLFTCLFSLLFLMAAPLLAERLLSDYLPWQGSAFHYNAFLVVPLLCASVDGALRVRRRYLAWRERPVDRTAEDILVGTPPDPRGVSPQWALMVLVLTALSSLLGPAFKVILPAYYEATPRSTAGARIVARIPSGADVEVANTIGPPLTTRMTVRLWTAKPSTAEWVVTDVGRKSFPISNPKEQRRLTNELLRSDYRQVDAGGGYVLMRRTGH